MNKITQEIKKNYIFYCHYSKKEQKYVMISEKTLIFVAVNETNHFITNYITN